MASYEKFKARPVRSTRDAAESNFDVAKSKREASNIPVGQDTSALKAAQAKAEGWRRTPGPTHTE